MRRQSLRNYKAAFLAFVAVLPGYAWSQSANSGPTIELYGRLDASVNLHRYSATPARPGQNASFVSSDTSYWGVRGTEDLGGGSRAYFKLENGFNVDTGAMSNPTTLFNREAFVGLGHASYGSIQLGSQWSPSLLLTAKVDPFRRSNTGAILTLFQQGGAAGPRGYPGQYNNSIQYLSPTVGGFFGRVLVATNEGASQFGYPKSLSLEYTQGRLFAGVVYDRLNTAGSAVGRPTVAAVTNSTVSAGATYRFDLFKVHGYYLKNKIEGTTGMTGGMLGVSVPVGAGEIQATVQRRNVDDVANSDAQLVAVQYMHSLSKRTSLYVGVGHQKNDGNANFGIWPSRLDAASAGVPAAGANVNAYQMGIRHIF